MKKLLALCLCLVLALAAACGAGVPEETALSVLGPGSDAPVQFTLSELKALDDQELAYSMLNNFPSTKYARARGCSLRALLSACGISDDITSVTVSAEDGFSKTFSLEQLLGESYYYDLAGSPAPVEALLAWAYSDDSSHLPQQAEALDGLRLVFGQQGPHQANASASVQQVSRVEVSCEPLPQLAPCSFRKTEDGAIELIYENMDQVKLYYTVDGSDPDPLTSPVYNPSTSNFQPELNAPLLLPAGTVLRAQAVGFGYIDSEISQYAVE